MTTFNTRNPVPSADARDRFDNSQTFDEVVNGALAFYHNRAGNNVLSLAGMKAQFNAFLQSSGYETPAPYAEGLNIQRPTQLIEYNGELYRAKAGVLPFVTTGSWLTDSENLVAVGDAALRQQLGGASGASFVFYGSHSVQEKLSHWPEITDDIGDVPGAIEGGDATAAAQAHINASARVWVPRGNWRITSTVYVPLGHEFILEGGGYFFECITKFLLSGTGPKIHVAEGCTQTLFPNPDVGAPYLADSGTRGDVYEIQDFTVPFSAGFVIDKGCAIRGGGVFPDLDGTDGYATNVNDSRLGADWDVAVWCRNSDNWRLEDVTFSGHFRKAAVLVTATNIGDGKVPSNELGKAVRCTFQGFRAVAIRSPEVIVGDNYGFAGTCFEKCVLRPLNHQSNRLATSSFLDVPFNSPSGCLEVSGATVRGIYFERCTLIGRDDICGIFGKSSEVLFVNSYEEAKAVIVNGAWLPNSLGSRMIASGSTGGIKFVNNSKYGVDFTPMQTRDGSLSGQRYTQPGIFSPASGYDDDYCFRLFSSYIAHRLRTEADRYIFSDYLDQTIVSIDGAGLASKLTYSLNTSTVADDGVLSVPTPRHGGFARVTCLGGTDVNGPFPLGSVSGEVIYDTGSSVSNTLGFGGGSFAAIGTNVTGTTGADGSVTVGVIAGNLRIENRTGAPTRFRVSFTG